MKPSFFEALMTVMQEYKPNELEPVEALVYVQLLAGMQFVITKQANDNNGASIN